MHANGGGQAGAWEGRVLGHYRLLQLIGRGGFAEVYLGEHVHLGTRAALKLLLGARLTREDVQQFRAEAKLLAELHHPHIVSVLDFGVEEGTPYLVLEYAKRGTLRQRHPRGSLVPPEQVAGYLCDLAEALQYAHDRHIVHRDIKPENMLLGTRDEILLSDFGIAVVALDSRLSRPQDEYELATYSTLPPTRREVAGTVTYMSPEQLEGRPVPASDQYALASWPTSGSAAALPSPVGRPRSWCNISTTRPRPCVSGTRTSPRRCKRSCSSHSPKSRRGASPRSATSPPPSPVLSTAGIALSHPCRPRALRS